jgi:GINS complex subunit 4
VPSAKCGRLPRKHAEQRCKAASTRWQASVFAVDWLLVVKCGSVAPGSVSNMGDRARPIGPDEKLMRAWINERCSPVMLPYATELVHLIQGRMSKVEQHMLDKADDEQFQKWATYHALELDRIRFLLKSYLRCRLFKIQMYAFNICDDADIMARLSPSEAEFAQSLREAYAATMHAGVLLSLARPDLRNVDAGDLKQALSEGPDLKQYVVAISENDVELGMDHAQQRNIRLAAGVMTAVRFDKVKDLLEAGQVRLT